MVHRLATALGPLTSDARAESGDPDGFDGVTRRGTLERLLISDWLLAQEVPDEFIRRAVSHELGYLQLSRREPRGVRRSVALLDAGSSQLGSPRIAQLAALVVLARRAEAAHVPFSWGILQKPGTLMDRLDKSSVTFCLAQRGAPEPHDAHLTAWRETLGAWQKTDDLWIVGGSRCLRLPSLQTASSLELEDTLDPPAREVAVTWRTGSRTLRAFRLPLPEDAACARLLRAPWPEDAPSVVTAHVPTSNLVFCHTGRWVFARSGAQAILAYPAWAGTKKSPMRMVVDVGPVTAVGTSRRQCVALSVTPDGVSVMSSRRFGRLHTQTTALLDAWKPLAATDATHPLQPMVVVPQAGLRHQGLLCTTPSGALWSFAVQGSAAVLKETSGVLGVMLVRGSVVTLHQAREGAVLRFHSGVRPDEHVKTFAGAWFHGALTRGDPHIGILAFECYPTLWTIRDDQGTTAIPVQQGTDIRGVTRKPGYGRSGLVVVDDQRSVSLFTSNGREHLFTAPAPITSLCVSPLNGDIACLTAHGDIVIHGIATGQIIHHHRAEKA